MIMYACAVYDKKIGAYMLPQFFRSKGEGIRAFCDACSSESAPFGKHAEDFIFCCLGQYDDHHGSFENHPQAPEILFTALDAVVSVDRSKLNGGDAHVR